MGTKKEMDSSYQLKNNRKENQKVQKINRE